MGNRELESRSVFCTPSDFERVILSAETDSQINWIASDSQTANLQASGYFRTAAVPGPPESREVAVT